MKTIGNERRIADNINDKLQEYQYQKKDLDGTSTKWYTTKSWEEWK